jgi:hypothetical protein
MTSCSVKWVEPQSSKLWGSRTLDPGHLCPDCSFVDFAPSPQPSPPNCSRRSSRQMERTEREQFGGEGANVPTPELAG